MQNTFLEVHLAHPGPTPGATAMMRAVSGPLPEVGQIADFDYLDYEEMVNTGDSGTNFATTRSHRPATQGSSMGVSGLTDELSAITDSGRMSTASAGDGPHGNGQRYF